MDFAGGGVFGVPVPGIRRLWNYGWKLGWNTLKIRENRNLRFFGVLWKKMGLFFGKTLKKSGRSRKNGPVFRENAEKIDCFSKKYWFCKNNVTIKFIHLQPEQKTCRRGEAIPGLVRSAAPAGRQPSAWIFRLGFSLQFFGNFPARFFSNPTNSSKLCHYSGSRWSMRR